jgi:hypothetical protein
MNPTQDAHRAPYILRDILFGAAVAGGLLMCIYFGSVIGSTQDNPLSSALRLLLPMVVIYAVLLPRQGLYLLLFETAFLDLIKRSMIIFGDMTTDDVAMALAAAPLTLAGICLGLMIQRIMRRRAAVKNESLLIALVLGILGLVAASALRSEEGTMGKLQLFAESGCYVTLIFVAPVLLQTTEDVMKFMRMIVLVYIPVAIYGLWQYCFGLAPFEISYMLTGLTISIKELDDVRPRIFSTLNSNHVFSVVMSFCCVLCYLRVGDSVDSLRVLPRKVFRNAVALLYASAVIMSLRRTGWLLVAMAPICYYCFRSVRRTILFYSLAITIIVVLFSNADFIDENWDAWQSYLPLNGSFEEQAFRIGTFTDRANSYRNVLTDPDLWSWFGLGQGNTMVTHDAIGETLASYGVVGLVAIGSLCIVGLYKFHSLILQRRDDSIISALGLLMAIITSNLFASIIFQSHIVIFPANFFFWFCVGCAFKFGMEDPVAKPTAVEAPSLAALVPT